MHRHRWLKWSELVDGHNGHKLQFRACAECGKTQRRDLGYCDGVKSPAANKALADTGFEPVPTPQLPTP